MNLSTLKTTDELKTFLDGSQAVAFSLPNDKTTRYTFIQDVLKQFHYRALCKSQKSTVIRFLRQTTHYSRQQLTRLIAQYQSTGTVTRKTGTPTQGFRQRYTEEDIKYLAEMDERYDTPSGAVIKKLCERAYTLFSQQEYKQLATISVSHIYNIRHSNAYQKRRRHFKKTWSRQINIGERRKPKPDGKAGYIRIDTVHQGDQDGVKGVYHINAVDEVTQYEIILSCCKISELYLLPILEEILNTFPFNIVGFHADNGSEYINHQVAKLLNKLHIEMTKSRPRQSNDNALAESKNASVVRKMYGYTHIAQSFSEELNGFNRNYLIPFINYHRPCYFPVSTQEKRESRGKSIPMTK